MTRGRGGLGPGPHLHAFGERVGVPVSGHRDRQENLPHTLMFPINFHLWLCNSSCSCPGEADRSFPRCGDLGKARSGGGGRRALLPDPVMRGLFPGRKGCGLPPMPVKARGRAWRCGSPTALLCTCSMALHITLTLQTTFSKPRRPGAGGGSPQATSFPCIFPSFAVTSCHADGTCPGRDGCAEMEQQRQNMTCCERHRSHNAAEPQLG